MATKLTDEEVLAILPEEYHKRWHWLHESLSAASAFDVELSKVILRALALSLKENAELKEKLESRWSEPFGGQMQSRGGKP